MAKFDYTACVSVCVCAHLISMLGQFFSLRSLFVPLCWVLGLNLAQRVPMSAVVERMHDANMNLFVLCQLNGWKATPNFNSEIAVGPETQRLTTFQKQQQGRSFILTILFFHSSSFLSIWFRNQPNSFSILTSTQRPPPCSHINFRICSLYRWYATIFYSLSHSPVAVAVAVCVCEVLFFW